MALTREDVRKIATLARLRFAPEDEERFAGQLEPLIGAYLEIFEGESRARAAEIDRRIAAGEDVGPLAGVPVALKDNLSLEGRAVTCGSRILAGYVSPYTATAVERLLDAGAVPVG